MVFPKLKSEWRMVAVAAAGVAVAQFVMSAVSMSDLRMRNLEIVSQNAISDGAAPSMPAIAAADCPITLDLSQDANAMIGLTLLAPCLPLSDVMIAHEGMIFSAQTMASGSLFLSVPALKEDARVSVRFATGDTAQAEISMTEVRELRRFVVQWPESDGFAIHAFEGGASFDDAGHIWVQNLAAPLPAQMPSSGYLTLLGDKTAAMPMLAQVYTFPPRTASTVLIEAEVTPENCGFDLMGDAISSVGGAVTHTEITVAMPECTAVGEFVQLYDLGFDMKLALAN